MTLGELRTVIPADVTLWLQEETDNCLEVSENALLSHNYDNYVVNKIYNDRYPAISARGITVILKEGVESVE